MEYVEVQDERIPALGFGTWQLRDRQCREAVRHALELGYRHLDTARMYRNEREVGEGLRESGVDREDVFLVTKIPQGSLDAAGVHRETEASLRDLGVEYVDLLLIHWPSPRVPMGETLGAMLEQRDRGHARHLGVSNFSVTQVEEALSHAPILADQVSYQPGKDRHDLVAACVEHDLTLTAYTPLKGVLDEPVVREVAERHDRTPAQVALRWLLQQDNVTTIPRSSDPGHREEDLDVFGFELDDEEVERLRTLR